MMEPSPWLFLIHQIPPQPAYLRVKVGRRLQRLGAVPVKSSVYVLPNTGQAREDFAWLLREIVDDGGEAVVCEVALAGGLSDAQLQAMFRAARDDDYAALARDAAQLASAERGGEADRAPTPAVLARLKRRLDEIAGIDFHHAPGRRAAEAALAALEARMRRGESPAPEAHAAAEGLRGLTWVTRAGVFVDRIATAWLVRRFVDPSARFRFVREARYRPAEGEIRFDMFEGELTHQGDRCTFEVLLERAGLQGDPALAAVAEVV